ncbi:MAG: hypothetical protein OEU97_04915 [Dehalococcoidia bacterium]|nr:hypothetical protein [Dehalococcoidia bacterium]
MGGEDINAPGSSGAGSDQKATRKERAIAEMIKRSKAEAKHTFQYFFPRQKTPPIMLNTAKIASSAPRAKSGLSLRRAAANVNKNAPVIIIRIPAAVLILALFRYERFSHSYGSQLKNG